MRQPRRPRLWHRAACLCPLGGLAALPGSVEEPAGRLAEGPVRQPHAGLAKAELRKSGPGPAAAPAPPPPTPPPPEAAVLADWEQLRVLEGLLQHPDALVRDSVGLAVQAAIEEREARQSRRGEPPWYAKWYTGYAYLFFGVEVAVMSLIVIAFEGAWLQSSLAPSQGCWERCRKSWRALVSRLQDRHSWSRLGSASDATESGEERLCGSSKGAVSFWETISAGVELQEPAAHLGAGPVHEQTGSGTKQDRIEVWSLLQVNTFWKFILDTRQTNSGEAAGEENEEDDDGEEPDKEWVFFPKRQFMGRAGHRAYVELRRKGDLSKALTVVARTVETPESQFAARADRDFIHITAELTFQPGQAIQVFEVRLPRAEKMWVPTRWFRVELVHIGCRAPSFLGSVASEKEACRGPEAIVYILQSVDFPPGATKDMWSEESTGFYLMLYYLKMQCHARGAKWFKTLVGLLYDPFHQVGVTSVIKALLLDWAANAEYGPCHYYEIILLGICWFFSTALQRWGDQCQTKMRGRTGGIRQGHRGELFGKMMMLELTEQRSVNTEEWFYTALQSVDSVTADGYWQGFMFLQSLFALVISVTLLIVPAALHGQYSSDHTVTLIMLCLLIPFALAVSVNRRRRTQDLLNKRSDHESMWVDTWAWLAYAGSQLFSFGPLEKAQVEKNFAEESKSFVSAHQKARDELNDTTWIIRWATSSAYCTIMIHGGFSMLRGQMTPGQLVLMLNVALSYAKYLDSVFNCAVQLQKGGVALKRLCQLLNLPEHRSLQEELEKQEQPEEAVPLEGRRRDRSLTVLSTLQQLELREVQLDVPVNYSLGPLSSLRLRSGARSLAIPLGRVVRVRGGSEGLRYSFMALAAGVVPPTKGAVVGPGDVRAIMLAMLPMRSSHLTVLDALMLAGARRHVAENLARALGLEAGRDTRSLAPGELQVLALVRALLRDPDILVASRPLSYVLRGFQARLVHLLRVWQAGGAEAILDIVDTVQAHSPAMPASPEAPRCKCPLCRRGRSQRTLLITDEDVDIVDDPEDYLIDLEQYVEEVPSSRSDESLGSQMRPIGLRGRSRSSFLGFASALADSSPRFASALAESSPRSFAPHAMAAYPGL